MRKLFILVFVIFASMQITSAQGIQKGQNFFKKNKIEPVVGLNAGFNSEGNSLEAMMGVHIDKAFSFYLGAVTMVNYSDKPFKDSNGKTYTGLTAGTTDVFVKFFWNILGHYDYDSKIVGGIAISVTRFTLEYELSGEDPFNEKTNSIIVIPAGEFGYELSWSRLTAIVKYIPYENIYYAEASKFYGGISLIIPFGVVEHKEKWGY